MYGELAIAKARLGDTHDRDVALAWTIAALGRQKKLVGLEKLLRAGRTTRGGPAGGVAQHRAALDMLSERFGIPLIRTRSIHRTRPHG